MRLIDADQLIKDMVSACSPTQFGRGTAKMMVKTAPTIDPIRAAGGCRCGECRKKNTQDCPLVMVRFDIFGNHEKTLEQNAVPEDFGCTAGVPREAQDDG